MLAHAPLAIPQGTQLRGPLGSLRCSSCRGRAQTRFAQTPRTPFPRQLCATRPLRWDWMVRVALSWSGRNEKENCDCDRSHAPAWECRFGRAASSGARCLPLFVPQA